MLQSAIKLSIEDMHWKKCGRLVGFNDSTEGNRVCSF